MSVFDQYNQAKLGPENDYQQALGMLSKGGAGSVSFPSYEGGSNSDASKDGAAIGKALGLGASGPGAAEGSSAGASVGSAAGSVPSVGAGAGAQFGGDIGGPPQIGPGAAMNMVSPKSSTSMNFPSYGDSGSGGGGGMSMDSMAQIAGMFV